MKNMLLNTKLVHKKIFIILIILSIVTPCFTSQSFAINTTITPENSSICADCISDRYIIQFDEKPLATFRNQLVESLKNSFSQLSSNLLEDTISEKLEEHKEKILAIQKNIKNEIKKLIGVESDEIFTKDFNIAFNGIVVKNIPENIVEIIEKLPGVKSVSSDKKIKVCLDESVSLINADQVWGLTDDFDRNITGEGVTIAIIDTGVDYTHPDLKDNYLGGYDFVTCDKFGDEECIMPRPEDDDPMDDSLQGHGTHCAGIALGTGNISNGKYAGVAPDAKYYAYKIMNKEGEGALSWFLSGIGRALDPNDDGDISDHVDVISISGGHEGGNPDDEFSVAVDVAVSCGIVVVAAAGNDGPGSNTINSPGCARKSICVGSTNKLNKISTTSSRGPVEWDEEYIEKPDILAPGVSIMSTSNTIFKDAFGLDYHILSGTSMATPHVSGVAALMLQAHPDWTPDKVKTALKETAYDLGYNTNTQGSGLVNAIKAVSLADVYNITVDEGESFTVDITYSNYSVFALGAFFVPYRLPQIRFGYLSEMEFKAPIILNLNADKIEGTVIILSLKKGIIRKNVIIQNIKFF